MQALPARSKQGDQSKRQAQQLQQASHAHGRESGDQTVARLDDLDLGHSLANPAPGLGGLGQAKIEPSENEVSDKEA